MRGEIRLGELEDQKTRLVDTFYNEVTRAYGFRVEGRIDSEQFGIDADGKTLYWTPGDKRIPMTATKGKLNFLALSSLTTKYGVGGTDAVRRSLGLTGYTSKTSRLSSATERALRQAAKALSGSASNIENIELQDISGVVNCALRNTEEAETALDEEQSKALTTINDQPLDTVWVSPAARELAGLKKAMTGMRDEMVNNLAKLSKVDERKSEVEKHFAREHEKLTEASDPEIQQEIRDRIKNLERELSDIKIERESRLEALSANRTALRSYINRIRETFRRILHEDTTLAERIRTLFWEQGITIASIITAVGMAISTLVLALTGGGGVCPPLHHPPSHPTRAI